MGTAGILFVPSGTYMIDPLTITLANNNGITLQGVGFGSVLKSRTAGVMLTVDLGTSNLQGFVCRDLRFDMNGLNSGALALKGAGQHSLLESLWIHDNSSSGTVTAVDIDQNSHVLSVRDVRIRGASTSADGVTVAANSGLLDMLDITGCQNAVAIGTTGSVTDFKLVNSRLDENTRGFYLPTRILFSSTIARTRFEGNSASAIEMIGLDASTNRAFGVTISDNYFTALDTAAAVGITLQRANTVLIQRNHFRGTGSAAEAVVFTNAVSNVYLRANSVNGVKTTMTGSTGVPLAVSDVTEDQWSEQSVIKASVVATASLPTAAAKEDGRVIIEDGGVGDRNLVIYAGGERFRIDGGANV